MTKQLRNAATLSVGALGILTVPAAAQFGFTVVSDPGQYSRMATELQQAIRQYQVIMKLYQLSQQAYANMVRASTSITTKNVWMPPTNAWTYPMATGTYGTTSGWTQAINTGASSGRPGTPQRFLFRRTTRSGAHYPLASRRNLDGGTVR